MAQWRSRGSSSFGRNLVTLFAKAGLLLGAAGTVAAGDPPPQDIQPCEQRLVVVAAPGLEFRETDLCDPIPMMDPDPCAATWGIDASGMSWTRLPGGAPNPEFTSACWLQVARLFDSCSIQGAPWGTWSLFEGPAGYPLNINLFGTPSIGDFLPPSPSLGGSSAALLPPGAAGAPTGWRGLERPVHEGAVDLITGLPLARVSELELPFGGATFRLIRTRSQSNNLEVYACSGGSVIDSWWDWAGNGWMISESPLLLIDSAVPDIVGNGPRTTYLVLDAHHSIPFMRLEDSGRYEAPARFRATLTHNGRWESGGWQPMPTTYTASLYDGALTYTFAVIREDVPDNRWDTSYAGVTCTEVGGEPQSGSHCVSSLHSRPYFLEQTSDPDGWNPAELDRNPGQGVPYYGLCTRIEDQYGHAVEITFGTQTQYALDNPQSPGPAGSADPCVECMQDCPGKGQIRSIRLTKREGSGVPTTVWTLLYRYRIAPSWPWLGTDEPCGPDGPLNWALQIPNRYDHFGPRVVDSIFVYRGDEDLQSVPPSALTVSTTSKMYEAPGGPTDASLDTDAPLDGIPGGWLHRIRYHYGFKYNNVQSDPLLEGMLDELPRLLKISAISRTQTGGTVGEPSTTRNWVFDYGESSGHNKELWLAAIYEPEAVDRAVRFARSELGTFGVNHLALGLDAVHRYAANFEIQGSAVLAGVREAATVRWTRDPVLGVEDPTSLRTILPNGRPGYVRTDENVIEGRYDRHSAGDAQVATLIARTAEGGVRYHRFRRLAAGGAELTSSVGHPFPHRSAFHAPYAWSGYVYPSGTTVATPPSDYTKPRWITIIDEFEDQAAMEAGGNLQASGYFLPDDMTSRSKFIGRRVVHVGASGVILRDHSWRFRDGELMDAAGAGLGAEYIYWPVEDFLASEDASRALPVVQENAYDWLAHLRNELLLIEHRSVGWSVAENQGTGAQSGFVRFFEYELLRYDGDPADPGTALGNGWYTDSVGKVELKAEGVKEGQAHEVDSGGNLVRSTSGGPRLYLREVFRPEDPSVLGPLPSGWTPPDSTGRWEYLCDVRYLTPTFDADRLLQAPAPGGEPVMTPGDRPEPVYAAAITLTQRREPSSSEFTPAFSLPVQSTLTVGPGRQQRPGGPWYFPVQRNQHDVDGKLVRTMSGLVRDPINPSSVSDPLQSLAHTVNIYDSNGRVRHTIADVHVGAQGELPTVTELQASQRWPRPVEAEVLPDELNSVPAECWPAGWPRLEAAAARNYITTYAYNNLGERLSDVYFPNGRRWASRIIGISADESEGDPQRRTLKWNQDAFTDYSTLDLLPPSEAYAREYIFNEIEAGGGDLTSRVVGEIRDYNSQDAVGAPAITRRVFFATATDHTDIQDAYPLGAFLVGAGPQNQPRFMEEQRVEYGVDSSGRLRRADLLETGPNGTIVEVGSREVYDLVDVVREYAFDGAITRTTRNFLGQPVRRYIGTDDGAWTGQAASTTGLALVERYEYGSGTSDAWLPTVVRRYTDHPAWDTDAFCDPPASDPAGYATVTGYDWRMRAVRVDQYGETAAGDRDPSAAPRLTTTLTYLDHAGRPIVVATFGAGALTIPADLDPVQRREWPTWSRPSISQLYNLAVKPTSVVETFYGPDGETVERRTYHYDPTASAPEQLTWHEEHTYAGRGGQTVYEQRPSQPVTVSMLDGLARTVSTQRLGVWTGTQWEHELSRTDFDLDADGNAGATAQFERILATGDALLAEGASANAVRTRSVAWFDPQKRLTASAELGSESRRLDLTGESRLIAGQPWYVRNVNDGNADEPRINADPVEIDPGELPPWALLSINRYSILTGRLIWSSGPDGSITELGYDRAGRLVSRTENRFGDAGELSRTTGYEYTLGRLTGIAVSRTSGAPVSGDRQVTRLVYGAKLLEEKPSATPGSIPPLYEDSGVHHASLIGRMHLPVAATGEPSFTRPEEIPLVHEDPGLDSGEIVLRYTFDGALAERIDARGVVFRYFYDALGRLSWLVVGSYSGGQFATKLPTSMLDGPVPVDRIMSIQYLYNAEGRLSDVISRTNAGDPASVLTHTRYEYDGRGNLLREWQGHNGHLGTTPPATTARVDYEWSYQPTDTPLGKLGRDRLAAIIYPRPPNGLEADRRRVNFAYGAPGASIDDTISRITAITSGHNGAYPSVAQFEYAGVARRAAMTLGSGGSELSADLREPESQSDPIGLHGLDMFGRLRDLHFRNTAPGGGETLFRARHAYDDAGNRLYDDITQWPSPALLSGGQHVLNARSQLHGYDSLHRLTASMVAQVDLTDPEAPDHVANSVLREDTWWLDVLGNWQPIPGLPGTAADTGRHSTGNLDGFDSGSAVAPTGGSGLGGAFVAWQDPCSPADVDPDNLYLAPVTDGRNEVTDVLYRTSGTDWNTPTIAVRHDAAGNLVFDGTFIYNYDAWGRLVGIHAGAVDPGATAIPGRPYKNLAFGPMLKHFTYDGLGRHIRTQSPFPTPQTAALGDVRSERFYYDGIRRIAETRLDPTKNLGAALTDGDAEVQAAAAASLQSAEAGTGDALQAEIDTGAAPMSLENELLAMAAPEGPTPSSAVLLVREYVWGPGDAWHPASVDELLAYYGEGREAYWPIQDSSGDIAAVCAPGPVEQDYAARVVAQQRYDAYGQVLSADLLHPHAFLAAGHKGLFYDRLDRGVSDTFAQGTATPPNGATAETPRLVPFARGVYHVRNRSMIPGGGSPSLVGLESVTPQGPPGSGVWGLSQQGVSSGTAVHGRFMQADPNATGMVLVRDFAVHGRAPSPTIDRLDLRTRFGDGANIYVYISGSPWCGADPLGLNPALRGGELLGELAYALVSQYSSNLEIDLEWAGDWNLSDTSYTRLNSDWIMHAFSEVLYHRGHDAMLGPIADILGIIELGGMLADYLLSGEDDEEQEQEYGEGPAMAGANWKSPMRSLLKHGSLPHQVLIARLIKKGRAFGGAWYNVRVNRELIDPKTGATISKLRPDYFAYNKRTNTVIIGEACHSQRVSAAQVKLNQMEQLYKSRGYTVKQLDPEQ